jgi:ABC-type transport system involved in cytochrome bd biosynthesis fused ATPase/permease subunit
MTPIQAQIPDYLYRQLESIAAKENISIDLIVSMALSAHFTALLNQQYLEDKAEKGSWQRFQKILEKVPNVEPEDQKTRRPEDQKTMIGYREFG